MKKIMAAMLVSLIASSAVAKDETLVTDNDTWQMYTRPEIAYTKIGGNDAILASLSFGWMLNDKLSLGPTATGNIGNIGDSGGDIKGFDLWDLGLRAEYTIQSSKLCHLSASLCVAGGEVSVNMPGNKDDTTEFFVVEPGINAAVNVWDSVEIGVGLGYRFTDGAGIGPYDNNDFWNFNASVFLRFTEF